MFTTPWRRYFCKGSLYFWYLTSDFLRHFFIPLKSDFICGCSQYKIAFIFILFLWNLKTCSRHAFSKKISRKCWKFEKTSSKIQTYIAVGTLKFQKFSPNNYLSGMGMIGQALATLWMVVHSVQGIMFKDLKQISCTKCITIHRVIVLQIAQFLAQADILVNFFGQYYSGLFDNSLKYFFLFQAWKWLAKPWPPCGW